MSVHRLVLQAEPCTVPALGGGGWQRFPQAGFGVKETLNDTQSTDLAFRVDGPQQMDLNNR